MLGTDLTMPPVNVGPKSTPNYAELQASAIHTLDDGTKFFAGQSDDPFFVDLGSTFDLLTIRKLPGDTGGGVETTKGFNVHSIAVQVPINILTKNKNIPTDVANPDAVIGIWTTASRQSMSVLGTTGTITNSGDWVQVSRLGAPLVNEVVVPLGAKDLFNSSKPENDAQFANGVTDPEVGKLLKALYNINVPPQGPFGSSTQRDDLVAIFLTGIKGLTQPANVIPAEELRLNVAVSPATNPNRYGLLGGDNQGYPNGRRLSDDVVDISLRAIAGAVYPLFHPEFKADPIGLRLGDGVDVNDKAFRTTFPYLALPTSGFDSKPHAGSGSGEGPGSIPPTGTSTLPTATSTPPSNGTSTIPGVGTSTPPSNSTTTSTGIRDALGRCGITGNVSTSSQRQQVRCLQEYLIRRKLLLIDRPTGFFGDLTRSAVYSSEATDTSSR